MALELEEKIKVLEEYIEILKLDLLFLMAQRQLKPENTNTQKITTIKRELDKAAQDKMRLTQIYYGNVNRIIVTAANA